jgi:hypothetical protein
MKRVFKELWQDVRRASDALAYADLGEHLSDAQKETALRRATTGLPAPRSLAPRIAIAPPSKHVAFIANRGISPGALRYAISVTKRLDAELDILCSPKETAMERVIEHYRDDFEHAGIRWRLLWERIAEPWDIAGYVRAHSDVLFVVLSAQDAMAKAIESRRPENYRCDVPWVIVADELSPA